MRARMERRARSDAPYLTGFFNSAIEFAFLFRDAMKSGRNAASCNKVNTP